jgi:hypothetical protein
MIVVELDTAPHSSSDFDVIRETTSLVISVFISVASPPSTSQFTILLPALLPQFTVPIMLQTLLKFFIPQTLLGYRSQQGDTVKSARDFLYRPAVTGQLLRVLHDLRKLGDTVTIPFRITCAWSCTEDNKEDIVYVEAILPETENVSSEVHVMEKTDTVEGEHKITRFLVCFEDYQKLLVLQKQELGMS